MMAAVYVIIMLYFAEMSIATDELRTNERFTIPHRFDVERRRRRGHFMRTTVEEHAQSRRERRTLPAAHPKCILASLCIVDFHPTPSSMHLRNNDNRRSTFLSFMDVLKNTKLYTTNQRYDISWHRKCEKCRYDVCEMRDARDAR